MPFSQGRPGSARWSRGTQLRTSVIPANAGIHFHHHTQQPGFPRSREWRGGHPRGRRDRGAELGRP